MSAAFDASAALDAAVTALLAGDLVAYPTETVYGLGAHALSASALERLLHLKGRSGDKGMSVLVSDMVACRDLVAGEIPEPARRAAERFWPGPLTIVLPAAGCVPERLCGATGGVGLRCSSDRKSTV